MILGFAAGERREEQNRDACNPRMGPRRLHDIKVYHPPADCGKFQFM